VLTDEEKSDLGSQDLGGVIKRFNNKRAKDFNPSSLKEYGRRVHRAIDLFLNWRDDPANFTVKTRTTAGSRKKGQAAEIAGPDEATSSLGAGNGWPTRNVSLIPAGKTGCRSHAC